MITTLEAQRETAGKAVFVVIGAPVVTGRKLRDLGLRIAGELVGETDEWEAEGRKITGQLQEYKVVEQAKDRVELVQERVDVEQLQEQVEKLRDQLERVLVNWRTGFTPTTKTRRAAPEKKASAPTTAAKTTVEKTTAKKTPAKKTTTTKTTAKKTTRTAAKKTT